MKTLNLKLISFLLMTFVLTISACKKDDPPVPGPPDPEECDTCITFEGADIYEAVGEDELDYGDVFYVENLIKFRAKYGGVGAASAVESFPLEGWGGGFSGDALATNTNIVQLDFTEKGYDCTHIEFDMTITSDYGPNHFNINGGGGPVPDGVMYFPQPDMTFHVVMEGSINTIEWPAGFYYDNLCVTECDTTYPPPPPTVICMDFDGYDFEETVDVSDTEYGGEILYVDGVQFRPKFEDHLPDFDAFDYGIRDLGLAGYLDENVNFENQGWVFGEVTCQVDLTLLPFANKKVSFDISNGVIEIDDVNEFNVNGVGAESLPAGIVYTIIDLGVAGNGETCYRVEITGEIYSLEWRGFEIAYDNLCIEEL